MARALKGIASDALALASLGIFVIGVTMIAGCWQP